MPTTTASRLQEVLQTRNLKQSDVLRLAEPYCKRYKVKLNKSDLSQFVNGKVEPGQWKLTILGLALNVSEAWLMGLDVPQERNEIEEVPQNFFDSSGHNADMLSDFEREVVMRLRRLPEEQQRAFLAFLTAPEK